ncbi:DUF58 domain-containing protein [Haladaptatus sp. DYSN1]|uniref:DUF58 domain-containing protein n=1 Tax=unclassified Haladaptatus TaxID=2622732 RepID=UPI0024057887|nr:DUF58 domain-containing protein [Haladaptatus sp. DYSN1]
MRRQLRPDPDELPDLGEILDRKTGRWTGVSVVAFLAGALGVLSNRPAVLLAGVLGVGFAAYAQLRTAPQVSLSVNRTVETDAPEPGDEVEITTIVRNEGTEPLVDLRLTDGVPAGLDVTAGSPRVATALRPGESVTLSYTVEAVRGGHEFRPLLALARNLPGTVERAVQIPCEGMVRCVSPLPPVGTFPLRAQTSQYTGQVETDTGGSGIEFFATREYRSGDPLSRIDWNRKARTGRLSTLEFREERAATVVLLIDARKEAYLAPNAEAETAVQRSIDAASHTFVSLLATGDQVGVATLSPTPLWLGPRADDEHRARVREALSTHESLAPTPPTEPFYPSVRVNQLRKRLPGHAQLVLISPMCDDYIASLARRFDAYGHLVTVLSPDPTATKTPGQRLARIERQTRLSNLRAVGIRVIDWPGDESLPATLEKAARRLAQ